MMMMMTTLCSSISPYISPASEVIAPENWSHHSWEKLTQLILLKRLVDLKTVTVKSQRQGSCLEGEVSAGSSPKYWTLCLFWKLNTFLRQKKSGPKIPSHYIWPFAIFKKTTLKYTFEKYPLETYTLENVCFKNTHSKNSSLENTLLTNTLFGNSLWSSIFDILGRRDCPKKK